MGLQRAILVIRSIYFDTERRQKTRDAMNRGCKRIGQDVLLLPATRQVPRMHSLRPHLDSTRGDDEDIELPAIIGNEVTCSACNTSASNGAGCKSAHSAVRSRANLHNQRTDIIGATVRPVFCRRIRSPLSLQSVSGAMLDDNTSSEMNVPGGQITQGKRRRAHVQQCLREPRNVVLLINTDVEETFVIRPEKKETVSQQGMVKRSHTTLEALRSGISAYTTTVCRGNDSTPEDNLESYCCKLPKKKMYYYYKSVRVLEGYVDKTVDRVHRAEENKTPAEEEVDAFNLIKRYVECFATMAEFNFEFSMSPPWMNSGLPNVLVVDKIWTYTHTKQVYVPSYKLLQGDVYTDYVVSSLKRFYGCDMIEFISTLHTSLFANYRALQESPKPKQTLIYKSPSQPAVRRQNSLTPTSAQHSASTQTSTAPGTTAMSNRPLKKRKRFPFLSSSLPNQHVQEEDVLSTQQQAWTRQQRPVIIGSAEDVAAKEDQRPENDEFSCGGTYGNTSAQERKPAVPGPDETEEISSEHRWSSTISNPTLIVFRQNFVKREPILICPICIEIHLSNDVKYN